MWKVAYFLVQRLALITMYFNISFMGVAANTDKVDYCEVLVILELLYTRHTRNKPSHM